MRALAHVLTYPAWNFDSHGPSSGTSAASAAAILPGQHFTSPAKLSTKFNQ